MNKVIRSVYLDNKQLLVLLDDFHERVLEVPETKKNRVVGVKNLRQTVQSEIYLSEKDAERFKKLTNIE